MGELNIFRVAGDLAHASSKAILIWAMHKNRSAQGVSLITQVLYMAVFCTRYLDIFWTPLSASNGLFRIFLYLFVFKVLYIASSVYIVFAMMHTFARTREREKAWRFGGYCLAAAVLGCVPVTLVFEGPSMLRWWEIFWSFSVILESFCILPQLLLLRQTTVPTVIDSAYLLTLGSYRALYILNWIYKAFHDDTRVDLIAAVFGVVQTLFYLDFAWVYWSRQRVKLRRGGVVDADDLSHGWILRRLFSKVGGGGGGSGARSGAGNGGTSARADAYEDDDDGYGAHAHAVDGADDGLGDLETGTISPVTTSTNKATTRPRAGPERDGAHVPLTDVDEFEDEDDDAEDLGTVKGRRSGEGWT